MYFFSPHRTAASRCFAWWLHSPLSLSMFVCRRVVCRRAWRTPSPMRRCVSVASTHAAFPAWATVPWEAGPCAGSASSSAPDFGAPARAVVAALRGDFATTFLEYGARGGDGGGLLADLGKVFLGKNSRKPKKANHGARPCSHHGRKRLRSPKKFRWKRKRWMGPDTQKK